MTDLCIVFCSMWCWGPFRLHCTSNTLYVCWAHAPDFLASTQLKEDHSLSTGNLSRTQETPDFYIFIAAGMQLDPTSSNLCTRHTAYMLHRTKSSDCLLHKLAQRDPLFNAVVH